MAVKRRGDAPDATLSGPELGLLFSSVFVKTIRRICDNRMYAIVILLVQPVEAVRVIESGRPERKWGTPFPFQTQFSLGPERCR